MPVAAAVAAAILLGALGVGRGADFPGGWYPLGLRAGERAERDADTVGKRPATTAAPQAPTVAVTRAPARITRSSPKPGPHAGTGTPSPTNVPSAAARPSPAAGVPAPHAARPGSLEDLEDAEDAVVRLTNAERAEAGCPPVRVDPRLRRAAREHSRDMARRDYVGHLNPEGQTPGERMAAAGYRYGYAENIAWGYRDPSSVVAGWMGSEGHRRNMLDCDNRAVGVGVYVGTDGRLWTQDFGRR